MSDVVYRIDELLAKRGENRNNLRKVDVVQQTISSWSTKNIYPRCDDLFRIAQYLGVSMEYLLTGKDKRLSVDDSELLRKFGALTKEQQAAVLNQIEFFYKQEIEKQKKASL